MEVRRQAVGYLTAVQAKDLEVGMIEVRNFGYTYEVMSKELSSTGKTVKVNIKSLSKSDNGKIYEVTYRSTQKVAIND